MPYRCCRYLQVSLDVKIVTLQIEKTLSFKELSNQGIKELRN